MRLTAIYELLCFLVALKHCIVKVFSQNSTTWLPYCPSPCVCSVRSDRMSHVARKTVACSGDHLVKVPRNISVEVETLIMESTRIHLDTLEDLRGHNHITELGLIDDHIYDLDDISIDFPVLLYLDLDRNELDYFEEKAFWWSSNLVKLSARDNKIEMMHADAFSGLSDLRQLDLSGNALFDIDPQWFRNLPKLSVLNISGNNIHVIQNNAFVFLASLASLDLSNNVLHHLHDKALVGLDSIDYLSLSNNDFKVVPTAALQNIPWLSKLVLDRNHISTIHNGAFININITYLSLSNMGYLQFIDRGAFCNLTFLTVLDISHCRRLIYIDRNAFSNVPSLRRLLLQRNNLSDLEEEIVKSLPSIEILNIEGNNLFCDCNLRWLIDARAVGFSNTSIVSDNGTLCSGPGLLSGVTLADLGPSNVSETCAPRVIPLFSSKHHMELGDGANFICRAVGKPTPNTEWHLPSTATGRYETDLMPQICATRSRINNINNIMDVENAQGEDSGNYTCAASNGLGQDRRSVNVRVKTDLASVIVMHVLSKSITVTWRTQSYHHSYMILYRQLLSNDTYHKMPIEPYMKSLTRSSLTPDTKYQFCIASKRAKVTLCSHCLVVQTKQEEHQSNGIFNARYYIIGGSIGSLFIFFLLIYMLTYFVRRYNSRKREEDELYGDNLSQLFLASMEYMSSNPSPVTFENQRARMFDFDSGGDSRSEEPTPGPSSQTTVLV